jgi:hypothetical protein
MFGRPSGRIGFTLFFFFISAFPISALEVVTQTVLPVWDENRFIVAEQTALIMPQLLRFDRFDAAATGFGWSHGYLTSISVFPPFVTFGGAILNIPSGAINGFQWGSTVVSSRWGGLRYSNGSWNGSVLLLGGFETAFKTVIPDAGDIDILLDASNAVLALIDNGDWFAVAGAGESSGRLSFEKVLNVGSFAIQGFFAGGGNRSFGLFYAQCQGQTSIRIDAGLLSVITNASFSVKGDPTIRTAAGWWIGNWDGPGWGAELFTGGGLFWSAHATIGTLRTWREIVGFLRFQDHSEEIDYTLDLNPAWILLLRPSVYLKIPQVCTIGLYHWIPLYGGWNLTQIPSGQPVSPPPTPPSSPISPVSVSSLLSLLLTGMGIYLEARY